ncbi:hypothetical protein Tco_0503590, partial [Tanacetum coccineum]
MIDIYTISYKDYLEDLFANEKITNHLSGNPTFSSEPDTLTSDLTSPEVKDDIFDPEGDIVLDSTKDLPPSPNVNPLSGSTTSSSPSSPRLLKNDNIDVDELDSTGSSSFLHHFFECDSVLYEDFSEVDTLTSTDNEDKVFNPGILVHKNLYEITNRVTLDKNVKKISSSNASLILEDYSPPLSDHELPFHIEIPGTETLLSFSSENEETVFNPGILISKGVHSLLPELSHRNSKAFKVINIFEIPMEIFPCFYREDIRFLDVPFPVAEGSSETTTERYMENYKNVSQDIRDQLNAEAEAVQIILTGIDNDIYSTIDACPNACEMWKAIERLKQGESINVQDLETNLYWEFGKITSRDGESLESYYSRFYKMMNELVKNQCHVINHQVNVQFLLQLQPEWQRFVTHNEVNEIRAERLTRTANPLTLVAQKSTRNRGKAIVTSSAPTYDPGPATVTKDDEMSKEKEIDKLMALIYLLFKKIYKPT